MDYPDTVGNKNEYIMLPNRLIENIFETEWISGTQNAAEIRGMPVILYKSARSVYNIGLPKANQIENVTFSTELYEKLANENRDDKYSYVVFIRYTDSKLYVDFEKADYADNGRVKDAEGKAAEKIMVPRYYKILLGYTDCPLKMLRSEEYELLFNSDTALHEAMNICYKPVNGECFYILNDNIQNSEAKKTIEEAEKKFGFFDTIDLLKIPKTFEKPEKIFDKIKISILNAAVGKSSYYLKTGWTSETDDRNNVARLCGNMMRLTGVSENDKIFIRFGNKQIVLRVLENDELSDYQIGIPAPARKALGMNSVNDIVVVHRDIVHTFLRHSQEQTIAILGTVLAVFQVINNIWAGILICIVLIPCIMYFVLNEERIKVK